MKAKVDQSLCVGSQDCVSACPQVFKMQKNKASVYVENVPKEAEEKCRTATSGCQASAITIQE